MNWRYFLVFGSLMASGALAMDSFNNVNDGSNTTDTGTGTGTNNTETASATTLQTKINDVTISTNETKPYVLNETSSYNFIIQSNASINTTVGMNNLGQGKAITITNAPKKIINRGKIISQLVETAYNQATTIGYDNNYAIFIANGSVKDNSFLDNYNDIILKMNVIKGTATPANNSLNILYSGNAAYISINDNRGLISADVDMRAGSAFSSTGRTRAEADVEWTGVAVHGDVINNDGLIKSHSIIKAGTATSTSNNKNTNPSCSGADACASANLDYVGNAVAGDVDKNRAYIIAKTEASSGIVKNNIRGTYAKAELMLRESGNAVIDSLAHNKGFINASSHLTGSTASSAEFAGGDFRVYSRNSSNGISGRVGKNDGIVSGYAFLQAQDTDIGSAKIYIEDRFSANGIYGSLTENNGVITGHVDYDAGTKSGKANPIYNYYSGNGVAFRNAASVNSANNGVITGKYAAIAINDTDFSNAQFNNYGLLAGQEIFGKASSDGLSLQAITFPNAKNYGMYLKTDAQGNILQITKGASGTYNGRQSIQTNIYGGTDAYNIYDANTAPFNSKILNGIGRATGVLTLKGFKGDLKIDNSIINAYETAISYDDSRVITLKDSMVNSAKATESSSSTKLQTRSTTRNSITNAVIEGDDTSNGILILGNTVINGNINLGGGNDIFVYDHNNAELNGRIDLGAGTKDTFALYEFSGDGNTFLPLIQREAFHGKANDILGDKVTGQEFLGLQRGLLSLQTPGDYMDYGLYVGGQAKATFTAKQDYKLRGLLNFGTISLADNSTGDNLTILEDAYLSGIIEKDTNFNTTSADKITVLGNLAGNTKIRIVGVGNGEPSETQKTLITAPNDDNRYDEYFTFVEEQRYLGLSNKGRFNGSPHPWYLLASGNQWFLSPVNEGGDAGGNSGGGDGGGGDLGDLGDLGGIGGDIDGGNTGGGNGGTGGGNSIGGGGNTGVDTGTGLETGNGDKEEILAEIPAYISLMNIAQEIAENDVGILYSRLNKVRKEGALKAYTPISPLGGWIRFGANKFSFEEGQIFDLSGSYESFDGGVDKIFRLNNQWSSVLGVNIGYKTGRFSTEASENQDYITSAGADIDTTALAVGLYGSLFNQRGSFINFTTKYLDYEADIDAAGLQAMASGYMVVGALAGGHKFDINNNWSLEPMAQIDLGYIRWNDFYDGFNQISYDDQYYASGRLGLRVENKTNITKAISLESWLYAGVSEDVANESKLYFSYDEFPINDYGFKSEFEGGLTFKHNHNMEFHLEGGYASNFDSYQAIRGDVALRFIF